MQRLHAEKAQETSKLQEAITAKGKATFDGLLHHFSFGRVSL
jgi:hypothetical protein